MVLEFTAFREMSSRAHVPARLRWKTRPLCFTLEFALAPGLLVEERYEVSDGRESAVEHHISLSGHLAALAKVPLGYLVRRLARRADQAFEAITSA